MGSHFSVLTENNRFIVEHEFNFGHSIRNRRKMSIIEYLGWGALGLAPQVGNPQLFNYSFSFVLYLLSFGIATTYVRFFDLIHRVF